VIRWRLLYLGACGLFTAGLVLGVALHRRQSEEAHIRLYRRLLVAEAYQNHGQCKEIRDVLVRYIDLQEDRLDAYEQADQVVDEAERITRNSA